MLWRCLTARFPNLEVTMKKISKKVRLSLLVLLCAVVLRQLFTTFGAQSSGQPPESNHSQPKDTTNYSRPADAGDLKHTKVNTKIFLRDTVVNNTNPNLANTDLFNDRELSITVNPENAEEIVVTSFAGA